MFYVDMHEKIDNLFFYSGSLNLRGSLDTVGRFAFVVSVVAIWDGMLTNINFLEMFPGLKSFWLLQDV